MMDHTGKIRLVRLYEKISANGIRYFAGRIGAAKAIMFLDTTVEGDDPVWELFVQDGEGGQFAQPKKEAARTPTERDLGLSGGQNHLERKEALQRAKKRPQEGHGVRGRSQCRGSAHYGSLRSVQF